ncbi:RimJ/RimL family protein N-acetyltransferase [Crossiella equi]|uniref:RimJ/RimL family protein N-acetyltransferase n=1 Tax=Crossiella equi TaxID=130796 RepID=A0ABS5AJT0_9PSEU|nr:GNAT family N-acetyltransferase [Crossiella equi]MBP2476823.1 RimJ/RimL family protein N-acetyltransferase [Crossiella equi]
MPASPADLTTERLLLRPPTDADLPAVLEIHRDPATNEFRKVPSPARVAEQLAEWRRTWAEHGYGYWLVTDRATGEAVGVGGLEPHELEGAPAHNLYYRFRPSAWGRGYATEMARAALSWAESATGLRVYVATVPANSRAISVARKLGMVRVGTTDSYSTQGLALYRRPLPPPHELHTARLWLRELRPTDRAAFAEIQGDPETNRYNRIPPTEARVQAVHDLILTDWSTRGLGYWAVCDPATGTVLGYGGLRHTTIDGEPSLNLAYRLRPTAWGKGYAPELARAATTWAEHTHPALPVSVVTHFDNHPSIRVAEKLGFTLERTTEHGDQGPSALYRNPRRRTSATA